MFFYVSQHGILLILTNDQPSEVTLSDILLNRYSPSVIEVTGMQTVFTATEITPEKKWDQ